MIPARPITPDLTDDPTEGPSDHGASGGCNGRCRGVWGAKPPAPLDTAKQLLCGEAQRCRGVVPQAPNEGRSGYDGASNLCTGWNRRGPRLASRALYLGAVIQCTATTPPLGICRKRRQHRRWCSWKARPWRYYLGRERRMPWRAWTRETATTLDALGYAHIGRRMRLCGTTAQVHTCNACGDPNASVTITAGCNVRGCGFCARREARERSRLVYGATERVPNYCNLRIATAGIELALREAKLSSQRKTVRRDVELRRVRRAQHAVRAHRPGRAGWGWKLITISPQWDPTHPASYTVAALRARLDDVRARWRTLWREGLSVEGVAAAYARVELSSRGHVHLHALYFGPWQSDDWCARVAGCFVDVRAVQDEPGDPPGTAIREAVKYAVKSPSPTRGDWIGGERGTTIHPVLAARWIVASRNQRLAEPYGEMRAAMHAAECELGEDATPVHGCASCGALDLSEPRTVRTAELARELAPLGQWVWSSKGPLPPRVVVSALRTPHA